jgi:mono/diheme cytochrome c family protein
MRGALNLMPPRGRSLLALFTLGLVTLGAMAMPNGEAAYAQNIDKGKPAPRLFSDSCATCHRSPRGLAKGRFRLTLFAFLREHYSANSSSAWELTSYLESVDTPPQRGRARAADAKSSSHASRSASRPPAPVPNR